MKKKFEWKDAISAPAGYPVDVLEGGLVNATGEMVRFESGTTTGYWGQANDGIFDGLKTVPAYLMVTWFSYIEDKFYELDNLIDYFKMVRLFEQGYLIPSFNGADEPPVKKNYDKIITGFAPGGLVVLWLSGLGRQVEINCYQGKEVQLSNEKIRQLAEQKKNLLKPEYRKWIMQQEQIVPQHLQKEIDQQPIPFDLWETYRKKYIWEIIVEASRQEQLNEVTVFCVSGEEYTFFGNPAPSLPGYLVLNHPETKLAVPRAIRINVKIENELYSIFLDFDIDEMLNAFQNAFQTKHKGALHIRVNTTITDVSIVLITESQDIWITDAIVRIYK